MWVSIEINITASNIIYMNKTYLREAKKVVLRLKIRDTSTGGRIYGELGR